MDLFFGDKIIDGNSYKVAPLAIVVVEDSLGLVMLCLNIDSAMDHRVEHLNNF